MRKSTFPTFASNGSFTHHNGGFSIIDPADYYVGAPQVPPEREREAHPARRHNLKLKQREREKTPVKQTCDIGRASKYFLRL